MTALGRLAWIGLAVGLLALTGCTHWRHIPPVSYEQHRVEMRECMRFANGLGGPIVVVTDRITPFGTALTGLGFAANLAREMAVEERLAACMTARGYYRDGFTANRYGWKP